MCKTLNFYKSQIKWKNDLHLALALVDFKNPRENLFCIHPRENLFCIQQVLLKLII